MRRESEHPDHPATEAFVRMTRGTAAPEESREIVRHLLRGCAVCARQAEAARRADSPQGPDSYNEAFARLERTVAERVQRIEKERREASPLYTELLQQEAVQGLSQVHSTRRYASLALCELLLQTARDLGIEDPAGARRAAELAVRVAEQLDLEPYGSPVVQDLRAIAWAYFADTVRVQADLRLARSAMETSELLLEQGSGDPLVRAELQAFQASLYTYSGRFDEALPLLNRIASTYRRMGDRHLLGRTLVKKGTVLGNAGEADAAVRLIRRGMDLIDPCREPRLMVCATHNYIWFLQESGRTGQVAGCLDGARRFYQKAGDRRDLGRLRWLEGKLSSGKDSETALLAAREALAKEGLAYEAALAAMDLAVHYVREGRGPEMRRQAEQMLPLFRSDDMYQETLVALLSFPEGKRPPASRLLDDLETYIVRSWQEKNPRSLAASFPSRA
ncbi:MAG TPA: tetratricopeptide repeat protein [Thermoanaerobaculia bacterium]|nr:tetratricopeptide repeat protein [Thermoanaerobaculia bacterium]